MHSLGLFKRLQIPKKKLMDGEIEDNLFSAGKEDSSCPSCSLEASTNFASRMSLDSFRHVSNLPHSPTCNYGMKALINNVVHRAHVNEEDHGSERKKAGANPRQESELLRQWKRQKDAELHERKRESQAKQDKILEEATISREDYYKEREAQIQATKQLNRESEMKDNAEMEAQQKLVEGNPWKAVALLLDLNGEAEGKGSGKIKSPKIKSPKSSVELSTPRTQESKQQRSRDLSPKPKAPTKKAADLSRMREILLKLQNEPLVR